MADNSSTAAATEVPGAAPDFTFREAAGVLGAFKEKENAAILEKWGLAQTANVVAFNFDQQLKVHQMDDFLTQLFSSPDVRSVLRPFGKGGRSVIAGTVGKVQYKRLSAEVTNMNFFDKLKEEDNLVHRNGAIAKMLDRDIDGIMCSDKLRECILDPDSEDYEVFTNQDRDEFIFHVFKRLVLGGAMCQYDDMLAPYLDLTKKLYKDLVSVQKNANTGKLGVTSLHFDVTGCAGEAVLFPAGTDKGSVFCYVAVDLLQRQVKIWHQSWVSLW